MKLLITDIDGSLLPFGQTDISPILVSFLRRLDPHVRVTFATGKPFSRAVPFARAIGITTPLICANGALIKDPVSLDMLFCHPMEETLAREVIQLLGHDARCQLYPEVGDTLFFVLNPAIPPEAWRHTRPGWITPVPHDPASDMTKAMGGIPHKIAVSVAPADREAIEDILHAHFRDRLTVFHPKPDIIDIGSKNVSKGTAAAWLVRYLKLGNEDVIAVGDEMNDLSLFEMAGWRIARNHAPEGLLRQADVIVGPSDEALTSAIKDVVKLT